MLIFKDMLREFYFFRHGQTDWNLEGRIQGKNDIPLNETGRVQAQRLISPLRRLKVEVILSSDLSRARETAEIISRGWGESVSLGVHLDSRLRETDFGRVEGLRKDEIQGLLGKEQGRQMRDYPLGDDLAARLGAERGEQVTHRVWKAIDEFVSVNPHHCLIAVSTHGGVIRRLLYSLLGDERFPPPVPNGSLFAIRADVNRRQIEVLSHLPWKT